MNLKRIDQLFAFEKGSLQSTKCVAGNYNFITASADWKTNSEYTHETEALVFAAAASGSLGRAHYVNGKFIASDLCFILSPKDPINLPVNLLFYHIIFNELREDIVKNTKSGTSKEAISLGSFGKYEIPYFDIDKQIEIKNQFVSSKLTNEKLSSELTSQLTLLKKLRQQILQDAVQGKLVPQDPNDEPASKLLERIKAEKELLIREKKIKKDKLLSEINPEEIPFEIPKSWVWCRLGTILTEIKYGTSKSCNYDSTQNSGVLRIPNVSSGILNGEDLKYTNLSKKEITDLSLEKDDILIIRSNGSRELVGRTVLVTERFVGFSYAGYLVRLRFNKELSNAQYLLNCSSSSFFRELIETPLRTTVGINNINSTEISELLIPLPPRHEQHRIAAKIEQLLKLCDELEQNIQQNQKYTQELLQVALKEALEPKIRP